jgi:hypothetical protein
MFLYVPTKMGGTTLPPNSAQWIGFRAEVEYDMMTF